MRSSTAICKGAGPKDAGGGDCWRGSLPAPRVTGAIATVDFVKADAELTLLIGCTEAAMAATLATHRNENQAAALARRKD